MRSEFLNVAKERGYLYQCTNIEGLDDFMSSNKITAYIGFDCTAPSLHIGSLVQIMMLRLLQNTGHKVIVLLGGGTTKIGDPSGKDKARTILNNDQIEKNKSDIRLVLTQFIDFNQDNAIIVDNYEWLKDLNYIDFLRDIGKHFSINRMLEAESVKSRLTREQNLSFLEFNYMLLQAYDFTELYNGYNCRLQLGGSDQWGNIVSGIELGKKLGNPEFFGFTSPLITTSDGVKMGKTEGKAVWLSAKLFSPYDYWQYFRNVSDQDISKFLRLFTDLSIDKITELENLQGQKINEAKKILATEVTKICHTETKAQNILAAATAEFENQDSSLLPTININDDSIALPKLITKTTFATSNSAAKRLIISGSVKINDQVIKDINYTLHNTNKTRKISVGKKRCLINFE
ncbi:MAG: tyrosine--tRNA ligase [Rickettsiaceae bacterium H1]|nr:tyrosine--tRNA ligase [Rickettsiaceae bacterium H1]